MTPNRMTKWAIGAAGLAAAGVIAFAATGGGSGAAAQTGTEDRSSWGERYQELLAEELGISVERLAEAQLAAREQLMEELRAEGRDFTERLRSHLREHRDFGFQMDREFLRQANVLRTGIVSIFDTIGEVVGLRPAEIRERLATGESLADIAESQGMDADTLKRELLESLTEKINEAVASGVLSQKHANAILRGLGVMVDRTVDAESPGGWFDFRRFWSR